MRWNTKGSLLMHNNYRVFSSYGLLPPLTVITFIIDLISGEECFNGFTVYIQRGLHIEYKSMSFRFIQEVILINLVQDIFFIRSLLFLCLDPLLSSTVVKTL